MKLAVLADVHANFAALQAISAHIEAWRPDRVVVAGDLVNRGPHPAECLQFVQEKQRAQGWLLVRGNHEDYVLSNARPDAPSSGPAFEVNRPSHWTYERMNKDVSALEAMPFEQRLPTLDGKDACIVHASMRGNRDGIYPTTPDETLAAQIGDGPSLLCVGHTHIPLIRRLNGTLVVNVGSAGLPFDGNTYPAYAQLTWQDGNWEANIVRVPYDLQQAERDFYESGYLEEAGPLIDLVLIELRSARSLLFHWSAAYQARALSGEISMRASVDEFIARYL